MNLHSIGSCSKQINDLYRHKRCWNLNDQFFESEMLEQVLFKLLCPKMMSEAANGHSHQDNHHTGIITIFSSSLIILGYSSKLCTFLESSHLCI